MGKTENIGTIQLQTQRLTLRLLTTKDAQQMFDHWANDPKVTQYLTWKPYPTIKDVENNLSEYQKNYIDPDYFFWGIEEQATQQLIGTISASVADKNTQTAEIGYCIGQNWWNNGYTSEALKKVIAYLFEYNGFKRIEAVHDADNPASGKVMQKAGMTYEGTTYQRLVNNRGIVDGVYYAILKKEPIIRDKKPTTLN